MLSPPHLHAGLQRNTRRWLQAMRAWEGEWFDHYDEQEGDIVSDLIERDIYDILWHYLARGLSGEELKPLAPCQSIGDWANAIAQKSLKMLA